MTSCTVSDCKKDVLVLWDNSNSADSSYFPVVKEFLNKFIKSEKLRVEEGGTHLGFITFNNNRTTEILKIGKIGDKTELIQWLNSSDFDNHLNGYANFMNEALELANNVS